MLITSIFSFSHNVFKRLLSQGRKKSGLMVKSLNKGLFGKGKDFRFFFFFFFFVSPRLTDVIVYLLWVCLTDAPVYAMYTNSPQHANTSASGMNIRDISSPLRIMSLSSPVTPLSALMHSPQLAQKVSEKYHHVQIILRTRMRIDCGPKDFLSVLKSPGLFLKLAQFCNMCMLTWVKTSCYL